MSTPARVARMPPPSGHAQGFGDEEGLGVSQYVLSVRAVSLLVSCASRTAGF